VEGEALFMPQAGPLDEAAGGPFGPHNLPYGVFTAVGDPGRARTGVRIGDHVLDAGAAARAFGSPDADVLCAPLLTPLMAAGRPVWQRVRRTLTAWLTDPAYRPGIEPYLHPLSEVRMQMPFEVADYVDFYASEHHATNVGRIFRPDSAALPPNWKHLPIGYHGRAGTVVVSGTEIVRPAGQRKGPDDPSPVFAPSARLDFEAEVGFVVGSPTRPGERVALDALPDHVFGVCLVNDWSARDIQAWEYMPLGPFLGKSFATSVSPWIVPLDALEHARVAPPARDTPLLLYLDDTGHQPWGLDLRLKVTVNGHAVSHPPFAAMYWTAAQQLAHMTVNGATLRTGDLFASGTVSGPEPGQRGCLLELSWDGRQPVKLPDGTALQYLRDGDEVTIAAWAPGPGGTRIGFGEVSGRVAPALP
jgi:fumarylacetoacetase